MKAQVRAFLDDASSNALAKFRDAVRPIYGVTPRGDPDHIGSAVLVELYGRKCLVSAAHLVDQSAYTSLYLGADGFELLELEVWVTPAPEGDRDADHLDFAVASLSADHVARLSTAVFVGGRRSNRCCGIYCRRGLHVPWVSKFEEQDQPEKIQGYAAAG